MKKLHLNFLKKASTFCSLIICLSSFGQWNLADTTIQSARDIDFPHVNAAYLTTDMGTLFKSTDGGISWNTQHDFGVFSSLRTPRFVNKDTGFVSANYGVQRTFDGGQTWTSIATGSFYEPSSFSIESNIIVISYIDFTNDSVYVKKSLDYGDSFITIMARYNPSLNSYLVSFFNEMVGYVINSDQLNEMYKTTDGGVSFDTIQIANGPIELEEKFQFKDELNGYLYGNLGSQSNASRTWTGGMTYFPLNFDGFGVLPVLDLDFVGNKTFGTTLYGKVYYSLNNGQFWTEQSTPVNNEVTSISFANEMNGIAVSRDQIIYTKNGGVLETVEYSQKTDITVYPNPANNWIYIDADVKSILLYDLSGQLVNTLPLSANKLNTEHLKQGTYLLKVITESTTEVKKITIE